MNRYVSIMMLGSAGAQTAIEIVACLSSQEP